MEKNASANRELQLLKEEKEQAVDVLKKL